MIKLDRVIRKLIGWMVMVMTLIVIIQVFCRYVLNAPLTWSEELARYIMIWMTFLGATSALLHGELANLYIIQEKSPVILRKFFTISSGLLLIAFEFIMVFMGYKFMIGNINQISPSLRISMLIPNLAIPTSALIMLYYTVKLYFLGHSIENKEGE